jgi:ATP-dependent Clp protease adapter protein ClpS
MLSPPGWIALAIFFYAVCVILIAAAASRGKYQLLIVAAGFGVLGYGSLKARKTSLIGPIPSQTFPPETSLLNKEGFLPVGFLCGIEILNDDRTPMEFVVSVLQRNAGLNTVDAMKTMLEIHKKGGKLLPMQSFEYSRRVAELIVTAARGKEFPLICRAVRLELGLESVNCWAMALKSSWA